MEYVNIKLESLNNKQTKLNFDKFRQLTTDFLVKQLPKTEDSPLEMVVLVNNDQLSEWLNKYIAAMHKFTEKVPKPTRKSMRTYLIN